MERRKLISTALFLTVVGAMLFTPPLVAVFQIEQRVFGLPAEVIYLFACWAVLVASAGWLGRRLPREAADPGEDDT